MKPTVYALKGHPDLVSQGLRTLELCIDDFTAEQSDPIMEPVVEDVIKALFKILRSQTFNHTICHTALHILGKLGGRNRKFSKQAPDLKTLSELEIVIKFFSK